MDSGDGWLCSRNKPKSEPKQKFLRRRTSLPKKSKPLGEFVLTQSPPPAELFKSTKQSHLTQFFKPRSDVNTKVQHGETLVDETGDSELEIIEDLKEAHSKSRIVDCKGSSDREEEDENVFSVEKCGDTSIKENLQFECSFDKPFNANEGFNNTKHHFVSVSSLGKRKHYKTNRESEQAYYPRLSTNVKDSESHSGDSSGVNDIKRKTDEHVDITANYKRRRLCDSEIDYASRNSKSTGESNERILGKSEAASQNDRYLVLEEEDKTDDENGDSYALTCDTTKLEQEGTIHENYLSKQNSNVNLDTLPNDLYRLNDESNSSDSCDSDVKLSGSAEDREIQGVNNTTECSSLNLSLKSQSQIDTEDYEYYGNESLQLDSHSLQLESQFTFQSQRDYYNALEQDVASKELELDSFDIGADMKPTCTSD